MYPDTKMRRAHLTGKQAGKARMRRMAMVSMAAFAALFPTLSAQAESLSQALTRAYLKNPQIAAERAALRATDEGVAKAKSGWRPQVFANGSVALGHKKTTPTPGFGQDYNSENVSITLTQPVFNGFKTVEGVRRAKAAVRAGRQNLLAIEQKVLLSAAVAYLNVVRDRQILALRQRNIAVLREQLKATEARFKVGEITRTDVSQSRAAVAKARADAAQARAQLAASRAAYEQAVGHKPGKLYFPRHCPKLPRSLRAALARAARLNPGILAAAYNEQAARHGVKVAYGDLLPTVSLQAQLSASRNKAEGFAAMKTRDARLMGTVSIPIYQGGLVYSSVREARHKAEAARLGVMVARRSVRQQVVSAWNNLVAARQVIAATNARVAAARLALDGVRQEYKVGSRTTLDVLNARQDLLDARVASISARAAEMTAAYSLLAAIGDMTAHRLRLRAAAYDPTRHYMRVKSQLFGTHDR